MNLVGRQVLPASTRTHQVAHVYNIDIQVVGTLFVTAAAILLGTGTFDLTLNPAAFDMSSGSTAKSGSCSLSDFCICGHKSIVQFSPCGSG